MLYFPKVTITKGKKGNVINRMFHINCRSDNYLWQTAGRQISSPLSRQPPDRMHRLTVPLILHWYCMEKITDQTQSSTCSRTCNILLYDMTITSGSKRRWWIILIWVLKIIQCLIVTLSHSSILYYCHMSTLCSFNNTLSGWELRRPITTRDKK